MKLKHRISKILRLIASVLAAAAIVGVFVYVQIDSFYKGLFYGISIASIICSVLVELSIQLIDKRVGGDHKVPQNESEAPKKITFKDVIRIINGAIFFLGLPGFIIYSLVAAYGFGWFPGVELSVFYSALLLLGVSVFLQQNSEAERTDAEVQSNIRNLKEKVEKVRAKNQRVDSLTGKDLDQLKTKK